MRHLARVLALVPMFLLLSGGLMPSPTRAQPMQAQLLDACRTVTADKTVTLGPQAPSAAGYSTGVAYSSRAGCSRFVADIRTEPLQPLPQYANYFDLAARTVDQGIRYLSAELCPQAILDVSYYRKGPRSLDFTRIGGGREIGQREGNICVLRPQPNFLDPGHQSPGPGVTTYRIAVAMRVGALEKVVYGNAGRVGCPNAANTCP